MTAPAQRTYTPEEAAPLVGSWCKPSWLREKARRRRIPFTLLAGRYCFTDAQIDQIVKDGEQEPGTAPARRQQAPRKAPPAEFGERPAPAATVRQIRSRIPPRMRKAAEDGAA